MSLTYSIAGLLLGGVLITLLIIWPTACPNCGRQTTYKRFSVIHDHDEEGNKFAVELWRCRKCKFSLMREVE
jgi:ribosomal protein L37AE/L43A